MNLEKITQFTSILQNLVVILSIVVGGAWAYKTFVYEHPSFYETGSMSGGSDDELVSNKLSLELVGKSKREFQITMTLSNQSKNFSQTFNYTDMNMSYQLLGSAEIGKIEHRSVTSALEGIHLPPQESRDVVFYVSLPKDGTYLIEANPCARHLSECLVQRYVEVNSKEN